MSVIGLDRVGQGTDGLAAYHLGDLRAMDLDEIFEGADVVVHLASAYGRNEFVDASRHDTRAARLALDAAARNGVGQFVLLSSAMVYGARAENPIPLTESAAVAPNPLAFAENKATIERLGNEWQAATGGKLAVLRPSTAVANGASSWVARSMQLAAGLGSDSDPPLQFLHLDDLATALELVVRESQHGIFNVAPDGWVRAEEVRTLSGRAPRLPIPSGLADEIVRFSWSRGIVATPPGIMQYATEPWVVSNDRLRELGWEPSWSNVEAYVDSYDARPWAMLNAKRRQQLAMGGAGVGVAGLVAVSRQLLRRLQ
jgi:nucleoside-diphosphate-sugar epimerase